LLGWGYTGKITFVDSGKVSFSNPVRQCLFTFEDSQKPNNYKAEIAAQRLKEIYPKVDATGVVMSIPMPGHAVGSDPKLQHQMIEDALLLEELVKQHDVVFLLLDSREARWLPTVQSNVHSKICLTIALGFDTFLVMRHGLSPE
jgi:ubiquitin-like modifier-activating enzyme ATG7